MKTDFNFNQVGKRMPYTVPNDFFVQLEVDIRQKVSEKEVSTAGNKFSRLSVVLRTVTAVAALLALLFVIDRNMLKSSADLDFRDIEQTFSRLSSEDQAYLLESYQDDVFMNE